MSLLHRIEAWAARAALFGLSRMTPERASDLGGAVARVIGPVLPVSRVARANLAACLPELDAAARARVVRGVWENLGRTVAEFPHLSKLRIGAVEGPSVVVEGAEVLEALARAGGPAIFYSAHFGNWELLPLVAARFGCEFAGMYRAAANVEVDGMIAALRARAVGREVQLFPKGAKGARAALGQLARGGRLAMLVDQKLNDGIEARFFGLPAMTAQAVAVFALRYRCPVVGAYAVRTGPMRFKLVVEQPLELPEGGAREAQIAAVTQMVNDRMESWIRARPEAWLWLHRRWPKDVVRTK